MSASLLGSQGSDLIFFFLVRALYVRDRLLGNGVFNPTREF